MTPRNWPNLITEVAFNADPNSSTTASWTDVSRRVLSVSMKRGRTYELANADAGTATVQLSNTDGAFDPSNTSSPYSPNIKLYRAMRVRANYAGTTYSLVTGYAERWPQSWDNSQFGSDAVPLVDGLAVLAARTLQSFYFETVLTDNPAAFWPLNDASGQSVAADYGALGAGPLSRVDWKYGAASSFDFGGTTSLVEGPGCLRLNTTTSDVGPYPLSLLQAPSSFTVDPTAPFSFECWVLRDKLPAGAYMLMSFNDLAIPNAFVQLSIDSSGFVRATNQYGSGSGTAPSSIACSTSSWHHCVGVFHNDATGVDLYLDGVKSNGVGGVGALTPNLQPLQIAGEILTRNTSGGDQLQGSICNVAVYKTALTAAQVSAHYTAGVTAGFGDGPGARIARVLSLVPWRLGSSTADLDTSTFRAALGWDGQTALALIESYAQAAGGVFYQNGAGTAVWQSRASRFLATSSSLTFGDGVGELPYTDVAFDFDPTYVYNDVQITKNGGIVSTASDTTSQASYFIRSYSLTTDLSSQAQAADLANWISANFAQPKMRPSVIELDPASNAAMWAACLGTDIGTRVTVKRRPKGSTNTISIPCFVEGVEQVIDRDSWRTRFTLSPVSLPALIWDDTTQGIWDTDVWGY